jgi:sigma-B regulation protein RsbU (phosphoserine phosphatase)
MTERLRSISVKFLIRRSARYLLVSHGFWFLQAAAILAALVFVLTGSRIAFIDHFGNRADIIASIFVTVAVSALLTNVNRRVMTSIDRRFFREAYNAELVLTELGEAIPTLNKTDQLVELVASKINDALHPENVTIFLDNQDAGMQVAAFSSDGLAPRTDLWSGSGSPVLHYDEWPINQLKESVLRFPEAIEVDPASKRPQTVRSIRSTLFIPIMAKGRLHGLISLGRRLSDLGYATDDKRLLLVVASQIGSFIENMELLGRMVEEERNARELKMAADVQRHLFPSDGLEDNALEIYGTCLPALGVGGDYYDYFRTDDRRTSIAIADVAGKGISAALLMSTVQASLRCQLSSKSIPLADVVSVMNKQLQRSTSDGGYATFFLAQFDKATGGLTYVNAGHNPPMLVRALSASALNSEEILRAGIHQGASLTAVGTNAGSVVSVAEEPMVSRLTAGGPIIGTFLNGPYEQETISMRSGDLLAVYTDGVTEALNPAGEEFGEGRLRSSLVESLWLSAHETASKVIARVLEWQGQAPQHDDITLILVKVK